MSELKLTPTEHLIVSNLKRYKQMWNTISVPVAKAIFDELF